MSKIIIAIVLISVSVPCLSQMMNTKYAKIFIEKDSLQMDTNLTEKKAINRNAIFIEIGGLANVLKLSYSKNFSITKNIGIAPRIGFTTLGIDLTWNFKDKVEFYGGSRVLLLARVPFGVPLPFGSEYYPQFEEVEFLSVINSVALANGFGVNYYHNRFVFGCNIGVLTKVTGMSETFSNSVLSFGISAGFSIKK